MATHLHHHSYDESMDETPSSSSSLSQPSRSGSLSPPASPSRSSSYEHASSLADGNIRFFVLLLCPSGSHFDLVTVAAAELGHGSDSTIYDVLRLIQQKCAESRFSNDQYVGLVRTSDHVIFADLDARAFRDAVAGEGEEPSNGHLARLRRGGLLQDEGQSEGERECIEENDVLAAVLEGHSAHGTIDLAAPALRSPAFADAIGERSRRGREGGTLSVEAARDERRNELQKIMRDRSLGKDERRSRAAEVKRRYDELIERAERNEARLTEEQGREEERGLASVENLLADSGRTSIGEEGRLHCVHSANIVPYPPGPPRGALETLEVAGDRAPSSKNIVCLRTRIAEIENGSSCLSALEPEDAPVQREHVNFLEEGENGRYDLKDGTFGDDEPGEGGANAGRGMFEPIAAVLWNAIDLIPVFDAKGRFTHHESRGMLDQDAQSAKSLSVLKGRANSDELWDIAEQLDEMAHHRSKRNCRRCAIVFTVLFVVVSVSAIVLAGLTKQGSTTPTSQELLVGESFESEGAGATGTATLGVAENTPRPANSPVPSSTFTLEGVTQSAPTPTNSPALATFVPTETPAYNEHNRSDGKPTGKPTHRKHHGGRHSSAPTGAATLDVAENAPRPANNPVSSSSFTLEGVTQSAPTPTNSPTLATFVPTETPAHKEHNRSDGKPTGKPTHKRHDHGGRHSSAPTPKPTHKRHNHSDGLTTGKPTHKKHHGGRHSPAPTPKPTHKRHNHSDGLTTGIPTHRKHGHGGRQSSTPTPKPTHKHTNGGLAPGWLIREECYDGVLC